MTLVSPSQSNANDEITAAAINDPINQIASVVNGNIDSTNISSVSGAKLNAGTVAAAALDTNANPETRMSESQGNYIASGCIWSLSAGLVGTMTAGVVYIGGKRIAVSAVASQTFVASKDTYVSVDNTGTVSIASAVANNAASPSLPANSLWLGILVSSGAAITLINQGDPATTGPTVSSNILAVTDSNGVLIYPTANQKLIGYRQITADFVTATAGSDVDVTGLLTPAIIPSGAKVKVSFCPGGWLESTSAASNLIAIIKDGSTAIQAEHGNYAGANIRQQRRPWVITKPSAGLHTYKASLNNSAGTSTLKVTGSTASFIAVEIE
jgi:hypothetical protein